MSDYDSWLTTPPAHSSGCPHCGEKDDLSGDVADAIEAGLDVDPDDGETTITCLRCGWAGYERELVSDADARLEAMLARAGL